MRFYIDTSVFGGYWDAIFEEDTTAFFEYARNNSSELIYSNITERELKCAPERVRQLSHEIVKLEKVKMELIEMNDEAERLAKNYIKEGALTKKCRNDARHIALATINRVDTLVSWNFRHMVNFIRKTV
ncbi:MAG: PIN domain protein [Bacteroidota bacterium]